ncbi:MAG: class I adenylate-forming enzyme family protein [Longimicrobiales bacterium]|jgi:fatty-acyl-CoA synthase
MTLHERLDGMTIGSALATRATADPTGVYLVDDGGALTFAEVDAQSESLAAALANLGVGAGDRIALILPACPEFVVSVFAAAKLGAMVVPLNPSLPTSELQYMLRHSEAVCTITIEGHQGMDYLELFEELMPQLPALRYLVTVGEEDLWYDDRIFQYEDMLSAGSGRDFSATAPEPGEPFALLYTSGTSGKPKGVELSHANLLWGAAATAGALNMTDADRVVGISALFHVFGLASGLLAALVSGSSIVLQVDGTASATLDAVEATGATIHFGIPTLFVQSLSALSAHPRDLSTLRLAVVAGAPAGDEFITDVSDALGVPTLAGYSLTETSSVLSISRPDDPEEKRRFTVGRPIAGADVCIVDVSAADQGVLPVESVGEIRVRGPGVMVGYYRQPKQTAESYDDDGFFRTGDLGLLDEEGFLHLVGRTKDVIIRSGFNVYPREVEARIGSHPAIHEAAVVGVADPLLGEAVCACVVPVEGAIVTDREIVDWCRETLADEKLPDLVRFIDELPRSDTGQVRRVELSRTAEAEGQSA